MSNILIHFCYTVGVTHLESIDPKMLVQRMKLREGMSVGDVGSGIGYYALVVAKIVGDEGHVYAIDIQEDVLHRLRHNAQEQHIQNIETIWGDIEKPFGTKLRDQVFDAVIFSNTLFQLEDTQTALKELKRITKIGGTLLLVEWTPSDSAPGPSLQDSISEETAVALLKEAGFQTQEQFAVGAYHYAIIASAV